MDLSLSPAQEDTAELMGRLLADAGPAAARRAEPLGFDPDLWKRLAASGIGGMGLPESVGGGGAGLDLLVVAAEAVGRALAPVPVIEHAVAGRLLAAVAPDHPRLAAVGAGEVVATVSLRPAHDGVARSVPAGAVADLVLLLDGPDLVVVEGPPPGRSANLADAPVADRRRDGEDGGTDEAQAAAVVATGDAARRAFGVARDEWRVLTAGALVGLGAGALELTLEYVKQRHQFGVIIGSFQALQHGLAEFPGILDGARLLTHEAVWSLETGQPSQRGATGPELAVMALCFAGEAAREVSARAIQYHGGYGYATEQDPQLYYRRARGWSLAAGPVSEELTRLADLTFGPPGAGEDTGA